MPTTKPLILISNKTEDYDTLCGNQAAEQLISDRERLISIFAGIGYTATQHEIIPGSLHLRVQPPLNSGADVELAFATYGVHTAVSGQEATDLDAQDTVFLFLPKRLAETCLANEIHHALSGSEA